MEQTQLANTIAILGCAVGSVLGIGGFVFKYAVIHPLEVAIGTLKESVDLLRDDLKFHDDRLRALEAQVVELTQRTKSNQHRLDILEKHHEDRH